MKDYTWDDRDESAHSTRMHCEEVPRRAALTALRLVTDAEHPERILLVDPHPQGTWDTWMFPYTSLVLSAADIQRRCGDAVEFLRLGQGDGLMSVSSSLVRLRKLLWQDYRDATSVGYASVLPQVLDSVGHDPIYRNFSLKYSNTADTYTAYLFEYHSATLPADGHLSVPHVWVRIDAFVGRQVEDGYHLQGRKISPNVPAALTQIAGGFPR